VLLLVGGSAVPPERLPERQATSGRGADTEPLRVGLMFCTAGVNVFFNNVFYNVLYLFGLLYA
jgi:hypothetical protein